MLYCLIFQKSQFTLRKKTYYKLHIIYFNMMDYVITVLVKKGSDNNWKL